MNYTLTTYKGKSAIFCKQSRCFVLFGRKKKIKNKVMKKTELNTAIDEVTTTSERINFIRNEVKEPFNGQIVELNTHLGTFYYLYAGNNWQPTEN